MLEDKEPIGFVLDNATPHSARFVARRPPKLGDYVVVECNESMILGLVESVGTRSVTLSAAANIYDPLVVSRLLSTASSEDTFFECTTRLLGDVERLQLPRTPPLPGSPVYEAPTEILLKVFGGREPYKIRVGVLASRPEVPVYIDVNKMVTRHLAILAVTGAGKSNTVAVISDRLVRVGGTVLIFDFHGEYIDSGIGGGKLNIIEPRLNPSKLTVSELMTLLGIEPRYYNQERVLRRAYERAKKYEGVPFLEALKQSVEALKGKEDRKAIAAVLNKIEGLAEKHRDILDDHAEDVISRIKLGHANVVDLSKVDEEAADVVVSHFLRRILAERKRYKVCGKGFPSPIMIFIEEAHVLAPRDRQTLSKYWLSRIAREGRKFGIGLGIVSQRPKGIDQDTLSQANNKIILRIVEPSDQRYIQEASETLSSDLVEYLPSLNVGEAIIVGPLLPIPALVKIDKFEGNLGGADIDVVSEWSKLEERSSEEGVELIKSLLTDLGLR